MQTWQEKYPFLVNFITEFDGTVRACSPNNSDVLELANTVVMQYHEPTRFLLTTILHDTQNDSSLTHLHKLVSDFYNAMEDHLQKEEQVLFPMTEQVLQSTDLNAKQVLACPLQVMDSEHREHEKNLAHLEALQPTLHNPELQETVSILIHLTKEHIYVEDTILFPQIRAL